MLATIGVRWFILTEALDGLRRCPDIPVRPERSPRGSNCSAPASAMDKKSVSPPAISSSFESCYRASREGRAPGGSLLNVVWPFLCSLRVLSRSVRRNNCFWRFVFLALP